MTERDLAHMHKRLKIQKEEEIDDIVRVSQVAPVVKNLPANAGDRAFVPSLVWEDPLEKEMATHSNILAWRIPWTEEPGGPQSVGLPRAGRD